MNKLKKSTASIKSKAKSLRSSGESQYEYDPSFRDADSAYNSGDDMSDDDESQGATVSRRMSSYAADDDTDAHLAKADRAMSTLQDVHSKQSSAWKRALKHKSGTVVYYSKDKMAAGAKKNGKGDYMAPIYKGELDIQGYTPAEVFGVVGSRKLWDDWFKEGNLVENLSDTSSLTYMCMQGIAGSSTRDLSLVEKVAGSPTGTITFVSTSVVTPKVPRVSGRVRASIALNGWVLEPIDGGTRLTYYLLVNVRTFVPALIHKKYLARRPTCVAKIAEYLEKHGAPPMAGVDDVEAVSPSPSAGGAAAGGRRRRDSVSSKRSSRSGSSGAVFAGLPSHVAVNQDAKSYGDSQKAIKLFRSLNEGGNWSLALDRKQRKIQHRKREGEGLPIVKGEATVEGATTEQVLGTILSDVARREWDTRFASSTVISQDNAFDQAELVEAHKGIFPSLSPRHYTITRSVDREDVSDPNGTILVVSRSVKTPSSDDFQTPKDSTKGQLDLSGFLLTPISDSSVKITHITQIDPKAEITPVLNKILLCELAKTASEIAQLVDDEGYAPSFIRWGEGPATLESAADGNLRSGDVIFRVGGEGKGTMRDGQQKAWLQYSDKMYERGLEIKVEPAGAATIAKVDGCDRTVEFVWSNDVKNGATVKLSRADGDGAEDVYVGGKFLDKTVAMEKGSGTKKKAPINAAAVATKRSDNDDEKSEGSERTMVEDQPAKSRGVDGGASAAAILASKARSVAAPVTPASLAETKQEVKGANGFPEDAMLVISKDLYFTRTQCAFMGAVIIGAYLYGKLS